LVVPSVLLIVFLFKSYYYPSSSFPARLGISLQKEIPDFSGMTKGENILQILKHCFQTPMIRSILIF